MLKTRIITAVALVLLLCAVLQFGGQAGWYAFVLLVLACAFWEWARLGAWEHRLALVYGGLGTLLAGGLFLVVSPQLLSWGLLLPAVLFWVLGVPWVLRQVDIGPLGKQLPFALLGFVLVGGACLALMFARQFGVVFLLSLLAICWAADIFAYFAGKAFGKRKLAPRISPGKSWEGAFGGAFSVVVLSWVVVLSTDSLPWMANTWQALAFERWGGVWLTLWLLVLSAFSVMGDLFESLLKRRSGLKDSSNLLPGHGGILDRIDAQLPVLPLAMLLVGAGGV